MGKRLFNNVSELVLVLQCHLGSLPKDQEGISVIEFSSPAMWSGVMGQVLFNFSRRASALMRCADTIDPRVVRCWTHPTVGELLLNSPTLFCLRFPHTDSVTSHRRSKPASSRLELEICPS
jgi:hypothetical protein